MRGQGIGAQDKVNRPNQKTQATHDDEPKRKFGARCHGNGKGSKLSLRYTVGLSDRAQCIHLTMETLKLYKI